MFSFTFSKQVVVLETGRKRWLGIGIVNEGYNDSKMPGWIEESVGYHTDDGNIFHNADNPDTAIITEGRKPCEQHTTARLALLSEHRSAHPRRPRGSQSSREKRWDESFQVRAEEPQGTYSHKTISKNSTGCRLLIGHKKCFVLLCPIFSCVRT